MGRGPARRPLAARSRLLLIDPLGFGRSPKPWTTYSVDRDGSRKNHGYVFEVPANAESEITPEPLIAMGRFVHEAVAVDPQTGIVLLC